MKSISNVSEIIGVLNYRRISSSAIQLYLLLLDLSDDAGRVEFTSRDYADFSHRAARTFSLLLCELSQHELVFRISQKVLKVNEVQPPNKNEEVELLSGTRALFRSVVFCVMRRVAEASAHIKSEVRAAIAEVREELDKPNIRYIIGRCGTEPHLFRLTISPSRILLIFP